MSDTELLDELDGEGIHGLKWVCRMSTTGRGLRLHQDFKQGEYDTPREAIAAYIDRMRGYD